MEGRKCRMKRAKHKKEASAKLSYVWLPYGNLRVNQSVLPWTRVRISERGDWRMDCGWSCQIRPEGISGPKSGLVFNASNTACVTLSWSRTVTYAVGFGENSEGILELIINPRLR